MKSIRNFLEYFFFNLLLLLVQPLPQQMVVRIGIGLGNLVFLFSGKRKRSAKINLDIIFADSKSPDEKNKIIKKSFQNLAVSALQCLWATRDTENRVRRLIEGEPGGLEILRQCLKKNKGIVFWITGLSGSGKTTLGKKIKKGDVIWTPPGVKHWHGAAPETAMSHLAIQEQLDGKAVDWMEKVTDEEYSRFEGAR